MDTTAITLCQENAMPIIVLNFWNPHDLVKALGGDEAIGTVISDKPGLQPALPL